MIAAANTGRDSKSSTTVIFTAHTNSCIRSRVSPLARAFIMVVKKLRDPKIDLAPARWSEKIARSTGGPACPIFDERGGYTVHPVPTPLSIRVDETKRNKDGGKNQNLRLFSRGNAISGEPNISGRSQLPNPPMKTGITKKKIIRNACAVTIVL